MTIKERVEAKQKEIRQMQKQIRIMIAEVHTIQEECDHLNRRNYTVMGDTTQDCADCGRGFF